ncbi:hypothetical protein M9458_023365, partial [Cirrhinus mrigala]
SLDVGDQHPPAHRLHLALILRTAPRARVDSVPLPRDTSLHQVTNRPTIIHPPATPRPITAHPGTPPHAPPGTRRPGPHITAAGARRLTAWRATDPSTIGTMSTSGTMSRLPTSRVYHRATPTLIHTRIPDHQGLLVTGLPCTHAVCLTATVPPRPPRTGAAPTQAHTGRPMAVGPGRGCTNNIARRTRMIGVSAQGDQEGAPLDLNQDVYAPQRRERGRKGKRKQGKRAI